jgi:Flp pilus assembly protein TadD
MVATSGGNINAVRALLAAGAEIDAQSKKGETALMVAVANNNIELVQLLLDRGADRDKKTTTGLRAVDVAKRLKATSILALLESETKNRPESTRPTIAAPPSIPSDAIVSRKTEEALREFQAGHSVQAAALFKELTSLTPSDPLAWHFLGQSLAKADDPRGARKAYQRALELAPPGGDVASRTTELLAGLPLPDPAKITLPSGLTLYDQIAYFDGRSKSDTTPSLFTEVSNLIKEFGPYPKLVRIQDVLLRSQISAVRVNDAAASRASLPTIQQLRAVAGSNLKLLELEAIALHQLARYDEAKVDYARWLQAAASNASGRAGIADNLMRASRGEGPPNLEALDPTNLDADDSAPPPAVVTFYRVSGFAGSLVRMVVSVDGKSIGIWTNGDSREVKIAAGTHDIGCIREGEESNGRAFRMTFESGKSYGLKPDAWNDECLFLNDASKAVPPENQGCEHWKTCKYHRPD